MMPDFRYLAALRRTGRRAIQRKVGDNTQLGILRALFALVLLGGVPAWAQASLSLKEAVRMALEKNSSIQASGAARDAAESKIQEAHGGFLPKVNYSESWARSDNPVFVFSSLLTQHQFGEQNFLLGPLNRPDFLNNFQSLVTVDQTLFDAGQTRHAVREAGLTKDIAGEDHRLTQMEVIAAVVRAYYDAALSIEQVKAADQAAHSAEADLQRAENVRAAGLSTDADVLSIRVHLAGVREQQIRRSADLDVARAALDDALGQRLDTAYSLTSPLVPLAMPAGLVTDFEKSAIADRPEARQSKLSANLAETQAADARSALLPDVVLHGAFEADRQTFYDRGGANWLVSLGLHWNLFNGFSDKARIEETKSLLSRSHAQQESMNSAIRLQVRRAYADLRAAEQRIDVAKASVAEAEESLRITQNRYQAGMNNVTDLLRTETAVLDARTCYLAAIHDQRIAAMMLALAGGTLTADSEVLN
jgi:outer membrane protein